MRTTTSILAMVSVTLLATCAACKRGQAEGEGSGNEASSAEASQQTKVELPQLTPTPVQGWGIQIGLPAGAAVGEIDEGDEELEVPDNVTISTEKACGYDVELSRHWAKNLDSTYTDAKGIANGLTNVKYLKDEKSGKGFTIHFVGQAPLGEMYGMSTGLVVGDRLILCDSGLGRQEKNEADCVLYVCSSIAVQ